MRAAIDNGYLCTPLISTQILHSPINSRTKKQKGHPKGMASVLALAAKPRIAGRAVLSPP
jgi:hypothetical protein